MRSKGADYFNHDEEAAGYDSDVLDEMNPIRSGYSSAQKWIGSQVPPGSTVLDLGCGTGNTILGLPGNCRITAVDVSENMLDIARTKCRQLDVTWIPQDLLEFVHRADMSHFDFIVSCYSLHHLDEAEKADFIRILAERCAASVVIAIADLMYRSPDALAGLREKYSDSFPEVIESFDDEHYWDVETASEAFHAQGWEIEATRISDLTWTIRADHGSDTGRDPFADLSAPARRALEREGISDAERLARFTEKDILALHGVGPASLPVLRRSLRSKGLSFRPE